MIDPGDRSLGVFFESDVHPVNLYVDARSMKLLEDDTGCFATMNETIDRWLAWIASARRWQIEWSRGGSNP